jgi:hypothetical protein
MPALAIKGGNPIRTKLFPAYNTIGDEEKAAVMKVLDSGNLSQFLGAWHKDFYGGPTVQQFEKEWSAVLAQSTAFPLTPILPGFLLPLALADLSPATK